MNPHIVSAEVLAALLHAPRTVRQLVEYTGASEHTIHRLVKQWREAGVIYRCGRALPEQDELARPRGNYSVLWALQTKRFGQKDLVANKGGAV